MTKHPIFLLFIICLISFSCSVEPEQNDQNSPPIIKIDWEKHFLLPDYPYHFNLTSQGKINVVNSNSFVISDDLISYLQLSCDQSVRFSDQFYTVINPDEEEVVIRDSLTNRPVLVIASGRNPQGAIIHCQYLFIANTNDKDLSIISLK